MIIENVSYHNISCQFIINDGLYSADVYIHNTDIDINDGLIYYSSHLYRSDIDIFNMAIITHQLFTDKEDALLSFRLLDTIFVDTLSILYRYNTSESCSYEYSEWIWDISAYAAMYECSNPIIAILNEGEV